MSFDLQDVAQGVAYAMVEALTDGDEPLMVGPKHDDALKLYSEKVVHAGDTSARFELMPGWCVRDRRRSRRLRGHGHGAAKGGDGSMSISTTLHMSEGQFRISGTKQKVSLQIITRDGEFGAFQPVDITSLNRDDMKMLRDALTEIIGDGRFLRRDGMSSAALYLNHGLPIEIAKQDGDAVIVRPRRKKS